MILLESKVMTRKFTSLLQEGHYKRGILDRYLELAGSYMAQCPSQSGRSPWKDLSLSWIVQSPSGSAHLLKYELRRRRQKGTDKKKLEAKKEAKNLKRNEVIWSEKKVKMGHPNPDPYHNDSTVHNKKKDPVMQVKYQIFLNTLKYSAIRTMKHMIVFT